MTADGGIFALLLLFAVLAPFLLYVLVRGEHDQRRTMDREEAEREARRDTEDE